MTTAVSVPAPAPTDEPADWGALVREAGRLRREGAELNDRAEEIDARVAKLKLRVADIRAAALTEAAEVAVRAARNCGDSETGQYAASVAAGIGKELRRLAAAASGSGRVADETQAECTASISGSCLREAESETACDTEARECVYGGRPVVVSQPDGEA